MKSAVETLSPTRVKLTVEVPFDELKPSVDAAYRSVARQIRVKGFRPGKVPPPVVDRQVGRGVVLEEAVQQAIPRLYGDAVRENDMAPLGQPHVDVTEFADGEQLVFTAEVDVRPDAELPAYDTLAVTVEDAEVTDEAVEEQLGELRGRFATLAPVERAAQTGDYVAIDLAATVGGEPIEGGEASGLSYEVGSGTLMTGIDELLAGMAEGESSTFDTELVAGEYAGATAQVAVTVRSVKVKELPELDDEFAQSASEFDTLAEFREDLRARLGRVRRLEQGVAARDKVLEALLDRVTLPLPDAMVEVEATWRRSQVDRQLEQAGLPMTDYLAAENKTEEEYNRELVEGAQSAVKAQLVLDAVADEAEVTVSQGELSEQLVRRAQSSGVSPEEFAERLVANDQIGALVAEVRRGKALAHVLEAATITDASGRRVDLEALRGDIAGRGVDDGADPADVEDLEQVEIG